MPLSACWSAAWPIRPPTLSTWTWLRERSGLGGLLGCDFETMGLSALYRAGDLLLRYREALEARLFSRAMRLFGQQTRVTLVDLTNTCFEGEAKAQSKAKRGRSKEERSDCPLLTLGVVLDRSGFARRTRFRRNCWRSRAFTAAARGR
ncbi:MAG: hypothetical protein OXH99_23300 [Bryobacterales bacterium]|nr:hypothetical protein [Bryobacterales bacterium]